MSAIDVLSVTPTYSWPIPNPDDPDDVPTDLSELAVAVENTVKTLATIPKPVVNGQWIKGVGGAAVWAPIALADLPPLVGQELSYAEATTGKTVTATLENSADLVVAAPNIVVDGATRVLVELFAPSVVPANVAGAGVHLWLFVNGASIGRLAYVITPAASQMSASAYCARRLLPAAGNAQYSFGATQNSGNGTVGGGPGTNGNYHPAFIRVTRA